LKQLASGPDGKLERLGGSGAESSLERGSAKVVCEYGGLEIEYRERPISGGRWQEDAEPKEPR
jgi:hypothetical protein